MSTFDEADTDLVAIDLYREFGYERVAGVLEAPLFEHRCNHVESNTRALAEGVIVGVLLSTPHGLEPAAPPLYLADNVSHLSRRAGHADGHHAAQAIFNEEWLGNTGSAGSACRPICAPLDHGLAFLHRPFRGLYERRVACVLPWPICKRRERSDIRFSDNDNAGIIITDFANGGAEASNDPDSEPNPDRVVILDNFMIDNGNNPVGELKALMLTQLSTKGPDILAIGGGEGSSIRDKGRYRTWGLEGYGKPAISDTRSVKTFLLDEPAEPRKISREELGEMTYYGICSGCHAYDIRLIGVPTQVIQMIYKDNPQGIVDYIENPKNLREDYPEMPPQDYLSEEAKLAVAEYILTIEK